MDHTPSSVVQVLVKRLSRAAHVLSMARHIDNVDKIENIDKFESIEKIKNFEKFDNIDKIDNINRIGPSTQQRQLHIP